MSNSEQTLSIIKPDAVERNLESNIVDIFTKSGLQIVNKKNLSYFNKYELIINCDPSNFITNHYNYIDITV